MKNEHKIITCSSKIGSVSLRQSMTMWLAPDVFILLSRALWLDPTILSTLSWIPMLEDNSKIPWSLSKAVTKIVKVFNDSLSLSLCNKQTNKVIELDHIYY